MMRMKILSILCLAVCLFSCKKTSTSTEVSVQNTTESSIISISDIEALKYVDYTLDNKADKIISNWMKYYELETVVSNLKKADISYFKNNSEILEALIKDLKSTIPEKFQTPLIQARILALETKLYKLEGVANLSNIQKKELLLSVQEVLVAFSNLNLQMNKQVERESQRIQKP